MDITPEEVAARCVRSYESISDLINPCDSLPFVYHLGGRCVGVEGDVMGYLTIIIDKVDVHGSSGWYGNIAGVEGDIRGCDC